MASRQPQPWRWLIACFAVIGLLYAGVAAGGNWTPKLGLDLEGGASAVLQPVALKGHTVSQAQRNQAVDVIRNRVNGLGVAEASVSLVGSNIEVDVPGANKDQLGTLIGKTAQLRFRQVIAQASVAPSTTPSTSATPTTSGSVTPTTSGSASPTTSGSAAPTTSGSAAPTTSGSAAPTTSGSATPSAGSTTSKAPPVVKPSPTSNGRALSGALLAAGATTSATTSAPATSAAATSSSPATSAGAGATGTPTTTPAAGTSATPTPTTSAPAAKCTSIVTDATAAQQACLTPDVQKQIQLLGNCTASTMIKAEAAGYDDPDKPIAACDRAGGVIYVLAPSYMKGEEVKKATSGYDVTQGYLVQLNFTGKGATDFGKLTTAVNTLATPLNQIAIVLDGVVESAPAINQGPILGGNAQITGGSGNPFTQKDTDSLAQILNFGSLPISLKQQTVQNVSPTLGSDQLRGGLLAGAIGLGLVLVYSLLYYRGLGLVTIASLLVSAGTTYASVTLLGGQIGYRLSLAGIAGFIVAVGITADSFVVYFERLRDEVREGRTLRSGAERAWVRARRTIISADTVSLLAAAILYWLSVGNVRGFAFTLGLSTITDLFVVFFFTKPLISILARTKLYGGGGKFSGLGRQRVALSAAAASTQSAVRATPKEA